MKIEEVMSLGKVARPALDADLSATAQRVASAGFDGLLAWGTERSTRRPSIIGSGLGSGGLRGHTAANDPITRSFKDHDIL